MDSSRDDWAEGPGLLASIREFPVVVPGLLLIGLLAGLGWSHTRPVLYSGTVRIFVADGVQESSDPGRLVRSRAEYLSSPEVLSRVVQLVGTKETQEQIQKRFTVTPSTDANVITVVALAPTGAGAAKLADSVVSAYLAALDQQGKDAVVARNATLARRVTDLTRQLTALDAARLKNPTDSAVLTQIQGKREELLDLVKQREQLASQPPSSTQAISHREAAVPSLEPVAPRRLRLALVGALLGLLVGCGLAWWFAGRWAAARGRAPVVTGILPPIGTAPVSPTPRRTANGTPRPPIRAGDPLPASGGAVVDITDPPEPTVLRRVTEGLWQNLGAERLAVLLERRGALEPVVSMGGAVLQPLPGAAIADVDAVRAVLDGGPTVAGEAERSVLESLGILLGRAGRDLVVPLATGDTPAFGIVVVGAEPDGRPLGPADVEHVSALVAETVPPLHAWWVLRGVGLASGVSVTSVAPTSSTGLVPRQ